MQFVDSRECECSGSSSPLPPPPPPPLEAEASESSPARSSTSSTPPPPPPPEDDVDDERLFTKVAAAADHHDHLRSAVLNLMESSDDSDYEDASHERRDGGVGSNPIRFWAQQRARFVDGTDAERWHARVFYEEPAATPSLSSASSLALRELVGAGASSTSTSVLGSHDDNAVAAHFRCPAFAISPSVALATAVSPHAHFSSSRSAAPGVIDVLTATDDVSGEGATTVHDVAAAFEELMQRPSDDDPFGGDHDDDNFFGGRQETEDEFLFEEEESPFVGASNERSKAPAPDGLDQLLITAQEEDDDDGEEIDVESTGPIVSKFSVSSTRALQHLAHLKESKGDQLDSSEAGFGRLPMQRQQVMAHREAQHARFCLEHGQRSQLSDEHKHHALKMLLHDAHRVHREAARRGEARTHPKSFWQDVAQKVEDCMAAEGFAAALRYLSCMCIWNPRDTASEFGDNEPSRVRRDFTMRRTLAALSWQQKVGIRSHFLKSPGVAIEGGIGSEKSPHVISAKDQDRINAVIAALTNGTRSADDDVIDAVVAAFSNGTPSEDVITSVVSEFQSRRRNESA